MVSLYLVGGLTATEVGKRYGYTYSGVYQIFRRYHVPLRARGVPPGYQRLDDETLDRTRRLYEDGYSIGEIAEMEERTQATILWRLRSIGVPRRERGEGLALAYKNGRTRSAAKQAIKL
jgi:transposase